MTACDARDRVDLALEVEVSQLLRRDVGRNLHDLEDPAASALDGVVGGLNPDLATALADALVFAHVKFAAAQFHPEFLVVGAARVVRVDEQAVMFADDLRRGVAERLAEVLVGAEDFAVQVKFDDGERSVERIEHSFRNPRGNRTSRVPVMRKRSRSGGRGSGGRFEVQGIGAGIRAETGMSVRRHAIAEGLSGRLDNTSCLSTAPN